MAIGMKTVTRQQAVRPAALGSLEVRGLMDLSDQHGWDFAVLGQAPLPTEPVRLGDWLLIPAQEDTSSIPERTLARIQAIFAAGLRPKGFVVVHEAPKLLADPSVVEGEAVEISPVPPRVQLALQKAEEMATSAAKCLAVVAGAATVALGAMAAAAALLLPMLLLAAAAGLDPILVAVTEDDVWVEIDRWYVT
jgi:hypothetical protein